MKTQDFLPKLIILFVLISPFRTQAADPQFNIEESGRQWFRYLDFQNKFQYSAVDYKFGEVAVATNNETYRVNMTPWNSGGITVQNSGVQGDQNDLLPHSRTENFSLPAEEGGHINFYRALGMWAPSNAFPPEPDDPPGGGPGKTPWDVSDKTEWEVQLRRVSDEAILATLDKVGIESHTDPYSNPYYGTQPGDVNISRPIPAGYGGERVYLQIVPRRWGPTPYGISLMMDPPHWVNISAIVDESGTELSANEAESIRQQWFEAVMQYSSDVKQETGRLPQRPWLFWPHEQQVYSESFFQDEWVDGKLCRSEIPPPASSGRGVGDDRLDNATSRKVVHAATLESVSPNPLSGNVLTVKTGGYTASSVQLELITTEGRSLGRLWRGENPRGGQSINLDLSRYSLANGTYVLALKNDREETIASQTFVVQD